MNTNTADLVKGNIRKLLFKLAVPAIIAQIVNVLYNIVDRIFIGRMPNGELAMAGVGGAPLAAIKMGENNKSD
ncbi:MATE efflux family domain protein [Clostridium sporogenes]|uniref:MATE efflux family domain protein n=1 Tax=Clostridium sporogenes TaxID=1509 RepID=A0A1L3NJ71_CLOSG|nr:MATE efflux family domain protein [Clostridium sporogenes]